MHIVLFDSTEEIKNLLSNNLYPTDPSACSITHFYPRAKTKEILEAIPGSDIIIFGYRLTEKTVLRMTSMIRDHGYTNTVFVLAKEYNAGIPQRYKKAGVDERLSINELKSPLLSWTLMSAMRMAEVRKKAGEFDSIKHRMLNLADTLAFITHEINNPLSVIRLALYHLQTYQLDDGRRDMLMKILNDNIDKVQQQMDELRTVRRQMGGKVGGECIPLPTKDAVAQGKS